MHSSGSLKLISYQEQDESARSYAVRREPKRMQAEAVVAWKCPHWTRLSVPALRLSGLANHNLGDGNSSLERNDYARRNADFAL